MHKDWLLYQSERNPEKSFIKDGNKTYSYKEVNDIVYDRACSLIDYGVKNKSNVLISLSSSLDFIEAYLACYKIGSISILLNHNWNQQEVQNSISHISIDYIICNWKDKSRFDNLGKPIIFFEELSKSYGNCFNKRLKFKSLANDIQSILFTSGTQGKPKGVCLTYDNFYNSSLKWKEAIQINQNDTYLLNLPLFHISGIGIVMRSLHLGFTVKINTNLNDQKYEATLISIVPTILEKLIHNQSSLKELQFLRCIVVSGSTIQKDLLERCESLNLKIFLSYGMTETCSSICGFWPFDFPEKKESVGRPFNGVSIDVQDKQLIIESNTIMKCYVNGKDTKGKINTSDLGKLSDGYVYLDGRSDNLIISGGENIDPTEAIMILKKSFKFDKIESFKKNDLRWGEISGLYIYTDEEINKDKIFEKLKEKLSSYKIPKEIIFKKSN